MKPSSYQHTLPGVDPESVAADWLARRDAGVTAAEEAKFQAWCAADPENAAAWKHLGATWRVFDRPREHGLADGMVQELARRQHRRRWKKSIAIASGLTAAAAAIVLMVLRPDPSRGIITRTEQRVLADGSVVELDRGAEIEVNYQPNRRSVRLVRGEALFTVAKNAARPFVVSTGRVDVQAVGTAFVVKTDSTAVDVIVTEGRVSVERSASRGQPAAGATTAVPVLVGAGTRLLVPTTAAPVEQLQVETLGDTDLERLLAWRGPRLQLAATRLSDAVALFNRENPIQLAIVGPDLAELRLSGVFRADNAEGFVRLLEASYGVTATRRGDTIELRAK